MSWFRRLKDPTLTERLPCVTHVWEPQITPAWTLRCRNCPETKVVDPSTLPLEEGCEHCAAGNLLHIALCNFGTRF